MAWTVAIILGLVGLSGILLFLNQSFEKSKQGIKVFLTMLCLASLVVIAQVIKLISADKASSTTQAAFSLLSTSTLILTVALFSFFFLYFMITYVVATFRAVKDSKKEKEELSWQWIK